MLLTDAPVATVLPAENIERARKFYTEVLGLKIMDESMPGYLMLQAGKGTTIVMYQRARTVAQHTVAGFMVDNLEQTMEELRAKGLKFEEYDLAELKTVNGVATIGNEKSAWFVDPEGNILAIEQKM